ADQTFDPAGNLIRRDLDNGLSSTWTYDARNLVALIDHANGASDLLNLKYNFDPAGRMLEQRNVNHITRSQTYSYDPADRLVLYHGKVPRVRKAPPLVDPLKGVAKAQSWELDSVGNWSKTVRNGTVEVRHHDTVNALTSIDGFGSLDYDKRGNLIDDGTYTYAYDFNSRLREIDKKSDDSPVAQYTYDALGRRIARTALDKAVIAQRR